MGITVGKPTGPIQLPDIAKNRLAYKEFGLKRRRLELEEQLAQQKLNQPLSAAQAFGSGVTSLIAGYPGQTTQVVAPSPSPIATAIGAGGTLAGIYRAFGLGDN